MTPEKQGNLSSSPNSVAGAGGRAHRRTQDLAHDHHYRSSGDTKLVGLPNTNTGCRVFSVPVPEKAAVRVSTKVHMRRERARAPVAVPICPASPSTRQGQRSCQGQFDVYKKTHEGIGSICTADLFAIDGQGKNSEIVPLFLFVESDHQF